MRRRPAAAFRRFSDETAEIAEAASQVGIGGVCLAAGLLLVLGYDSTRARALDLILIVGGAVWAAISTVRLGRAVTRRRALRDAQPGTAVLTGLRAANTFADEWHLRRYVMLDLLVTLPGTRARPMRVRDALPQARIDTLVSGTTLGVRAHPTRPIAQIDWSAPVVPPGEVPEAT